MMSTLREYTSLLAHFGVIATNSIIPTTKHIVAVPSDAPCAVQRFNRGTAAKPNGTRGVEAKVKPQIPTKKTL